MTTDEEREPPKYPVGTVVRVLLNERNRTPRVGRVDRCIWHGLHARWMYWLREGTRKVYKRYTDDDLERVERQPEPPRPPSGTEALAWYRYPEPQGRSYTVKHLRDPRFVQELFDYCQLLLAIIKPAGWRLLFETHGLDGLVEINRRSGWFDEETAAEDLVAQATLDGWEPRDNP